MTVSQMTQPARALQAFRARVDAFFGDPRAADAVPAAAPAPGSTEEALAAQLGLALARLGAKPAKRLRLRKSLTLHDGRIVARTGDATPLAADSDVRVVTMTTTVLDAEQMRVETNVLVFEREGNRK